MTSTTVASAAFAVLAAKFVHLEPAHVPKASMIATALVKTSTETEIIAVDAPKNVPLVNFVLVAFAKSLVPLVKPNVVVSASTSKATMVIVVSVESAVLAV